MFLVAFNCFLVFSLKTGSWQSASRLEPKPIQTEMKETRLSLIALFLLFAVAIFAQMMGSPRERIADTYRDQEKADCDVCAAPESVRVKGPVNRNGESPFLFRHRNGHWESGHCLNS